MRCYGACGTPYNIGRSEMTRKKNTKYIKLKDFFI